MENIKELLESMQMYPRLHLANYFSDLKRDVDLELALKLNEKEKYLEIINKIESIEQSYYNQTKPFKEVSNQEIDGLQPQLLVDLKYKIEMKLFKNESILFIKDAIFNKAFLLIINNAYLRKNTLENYNESIYFNRESLIAYSTQNQLRNFQKSYDHSNINIINLDNDLSKLNIVSFQNKIQLK